MARYAVIVGGVLVSVNECADRLVGGVIVSGAPDGTIELSEAEYDSIVGEAAGAGELIAQVLARAAA